MKIPIRMESIILFLVLLCGVTAAQITPRIINGDPVQDMKTEYPYMASLASWGAHKCGGMLIAPDIILTAAHCMNFVEEVQLLHANRTDEESPYESYLMRSKVHHPRHYDNRPGDYDPHDIALISLYGRSSLEPVKLNRDSAVPSSTSDHLVVLGWGAFDSNDLNTASEVLEKGTVKYIPNDLCKAVSGQTENGENVSFAYSVIADQNLCAADFENFQDICSGDSGGPILLGDTVVGVTSFSAECASRTFPAVYVRTSAVMDWIDDQICKMSQYPLPSEFGCSQEDQPDVSDENVTITFEFKYDEKPGETGWVLSSKSTGDLAHESIFHYNDIDPETLIREVISVPNNEEYTLTLVQRRNYGRGIVRVYEGTNGIKNSSAVYLNERINYIHRYSTPFYTFIVGELPSTMPTATPAPSLTELPRPFISVEIVVDDYPSEIGWSVMALSEDDDVLVDVRYPGSYRDVPKGNTTVEIVDLLPSSSSSSTRQEYKFMITDNEGDGITYGRVRVYWGDITDGNLLFENNKPFEFEDVHYFFEILPTSSPTSSPSPSISPLSAAPSISLSASPSIPPLSAAPSISLSASPSISPLSASPSISLSASPSISPLSASPSVSAFDVPASSSKKKGNKKTRTLSPSPVVSDAPIYVMAKKEGKKKRVSQKVTHYSKKKKASDKI